MVTHTGISFQSICKHKDRFRQQIGTYSYGQNGVAGERLKSLQLRT